MKYFSNSFSAINWFNIEQFLKESYQILIKNGFLVIYENYFTAKVEQKPDLKNWYKESFLRRYPSPPRNNNYDWGVENLKAHNFLSVNKEEYENTVMMDKTQLINYLLTQSNVIAKVEYGSATIEEVKVWLENQLNSLINAEEKIEFIYGNSILYLKKI